MDIVQEIHKSIDNLIANGGVQKIIEEKVGAMVSEIIKDAVSYDSKFRDEFKKYVKENLGFNPSRVNFPAYNELITNAVAKHCAQLGEVGAEKIAKRFTDEMLRKTIPTTKKISIEEFVEKILNCYSYSPDEVEWDDGYGRKEISFHSDVHSNLIFFYFDTEEGKRHYQCRFQFVVEKETNTIWSCSIGGGGRQKDADALNLMLGYKFAEVEITDADKNPEINSVHIHSEKIER